MDRLYTGGTSVNHYLVIPEIHVQNANAQPAWWMIGPPPVTAYMGFVHAMELFLGAKSNGVGIVHHDIDFPGERIDWSFRPAQFKSASFIDKADYIAGTNTLSSQPTARCHLVCSLVIRFDEDEMVDESMVFRFLRGRRLAGGDILTHGNLILLSKEANEEKVFWALKRNVRRSLWGISDRKDLMVMVDGERDMLDAILRLTRRFSKSEKSVNTNPKMKWLMPTTVGYVEISGKAHRRNVRGEMLHAYAEPLVGLIQYRTLSKENGLQFWSPSCPMPGVYLASAKQS